MAAASAGGLALVGSGQAWRASDGEDEVEPISTASFDWSTHHDALGFSVLLLQ